MPKDPNVVGAFWIKEKNGRKYLSGIIDGIGSVVVFHNKKKQSEKSPDYRVLRSVKREQPQERQPGDEGF